MTAAAFTAPRLAATPDAALAEAPVQCARMHACEAMVIGAPDGEHDVPDELLRIAEVPVIVVPPRGDRLEEWS